MAAKSNIQYDCARSSSSAKGLVTSTVHRNRVSQQKSERHEIRKNAPETWEANNAASNHVQASGTSLFSSHQRGPFVEYKDDSDIDFCTVIASGRELHPGLLPAARILNMFSIIITIRNLRTYLKGQGDKSIEHGLVSKKSTSIEIGILDFIVNALNRSLAVNSERKQIHQQKQQIESTTSGWKPCAQLKHYKQIGNRRSSPSSQQCEAQILQFNNRVFDKNHLPADYPTEISDMKYEKNRLLSFHLKGKTPFIELCKTGQQPTILAANGFFYLQEADKVKCAFCLGTLFNWDEGEDVQESHRLRFATCPLLLNLDVGNIPLPAPDDPKDVKLPVECSESESVPVAATAFLDNAPSVSITATFTANSAAAAEAMTAAKPDCESERLFQLYSRPRPPVSPATAAAACQREIASNLDMFSRSLQIAASNGEVKRYHPMQHPAWSDRRCRQEALARHPVTSRPVPADQLAEAGFFPLAGQPQGATACHWCGLRILHWAEEDNPWVEHARWSPRCCHLLLERGYAFVLVSRASHPPYPLPAASKDLSATVAANPSEFTCLNGPLVDYRIEPRFFKAREDFPPALGILELGCDPEDAKTAQFLQLKTTGDDFRSSQLFLESVLTQYTRRHAQGLSGREFHERVQRDQSLLSNREPAPLGEDDVDWRACKVCMDRVINVTLLDCKHLCCCSSCARNLETCPLCRSPIRAIMLVNME